MALVNAHDLRTDDVPITFTEELDVPAGTRIQARVMRIETADATGTTVAMFYERLLTGLDLKFLGELNESR